MKALALAFVLIAVPGSIPAQQDAQLNSRLLQSILDELRAMHKLEHSNEVTQILLAEWQFQQNAVERSTQRRDKLRKDLADMEVIRQDWQQRLKTSEESSSNVSLSAEERHDLARQAEDIKPKLAALITEEASLQGEIQTSEQRLQTEQATLQQIQSQIQDQLKQIQSDRLSGIPN